MLQPILTKKSYISMKGKVFYTDRRQRIDLKKPVRDLIRAENGVFYVMELCLSQEKTLERVVSLSKQEVTPIILYFVRGEES